MKSLRALQKQIINSRKIINRRDLRKYSASIYSSAFWLVCSTLHTSSKLNQMYNKEPRTDRCRIQCKNIVIISLSRFWSISNMIILVSQLNWNQHPTFHEWNQIKGIIYKKIKVGVLKNIVILFSDRALILSNYFNIRMFYWTTRRYPCT